MDINKEVSTYLGQKGYTIYKESLSMKEQEYIRNELSVKPYVPKSPVQPQPFPIYRESKYKFYVPKYFGIENYGIPDEIRIDTPESINIEFKGELRELQREIVNTYIKSAKTSGGGLIDIYCAAGKTVLSLNIISILKVKTLIIVHKGFLLNQWIERIKEFLPDARIGVIQGQIIDIENKDIVIGMLQSLSMKEYPYTMFSSFGLTIADETHHLGSEIFSRSLQKIVTKYTLGLSATMQRKDGLTKVFKMFLGDIVYKGKREQQDPVQIQGIVYETHDEEFNKTLVDYKGQPAYSSMISKLCCYEKRSDFIIKIIKNEFYKNPNQQMMILGQNKNLLIHLYKEILSQNIASVGYYLGGMKEHELKNSENKSIVIATYAMASEGLDIKTLSTLFLVTPRTDITQAVGRILRVKHDRPLVIDLIDKHEVFQKQWLKRKKFYDKNKYKILYTNNNLYNKNIWNVNPCDNLISNDDNYNDNHKKDKLLNGNCLLDI